jgi:hypothetical protein
MSNVAEATVKPQAEADVTDKYALLGPFLGEVTPTSIKIWLYREHSPPVYVTIHPRPAPGNDVTPDSIVARGTLTFEREKLFAACIAIGDLAPNTQYAYRL